MATNSVNNLLTDDGVNLIGSLHIDVLDENFNKTGFLPQINTTEISIATPSEQVERMGTGVDNYGQTLNAWGEKKSPEITIKHNSLGRETLAMQLLGISSDMNQAAATNVAESVTLIHDRFVRVAKGIISNTTLTVVNGATTYVEGTDYVVKYETGMIMALSTGAIPNKQLCALEYDSPALKGWEINIGKKDNITVELFFTGKNRANGNRAEFTAKRVIFSPEGAIAFMGKEAASAGLKGKAILVAGEDKAIDYKEFK